MQQESVVFAHDVLSLTVAEVKQDSTLLHIPPRKYEILMVNYSVTVEYGLNYIIMLAQP